jgi:hypothetical protein
VVLARGLGDGEGKADSGAIDKRQLLPLLHPLDRHGVARLRPRQRDGVSGLGGGEIWVDEDGQRH